MKILLAFILSQGINGDSLKWSTKTEETKLLSLINNYRITECKIPATTYSDSLSFVAGAHCNDLYVYYNDTSCSILSWSVHGNWSSKCINRNTTDYYVMLNKPYEVVKMMKRGLEIAHLHKDKDSPCDAECAFKSFLRTPMFRDAIREIQLPRWKRAGVCIYKGAASVWFTE